MKLFIILSLVSSLYAEQYDEFKRDYVQSCSKEYNTTYSSCSCTFEVIVKKWTFSNIVKADDGNQFLYRMFKSVEKQVINNQCKNVVDEF